MGRVVVIGAAGFVGRVLCRRLSAEGHTVIAIGRANTDMLLTGSGALVQPPDQAAAVGAVDHVVNLAYPRGGSPIFDPQRNADIGALTLAAAGTTARVTHISSQAVFGLALDRPPAPKLAPRVRDVPYVEAKIALEHWLTRRLGSRLRIIRLGNVWGPGSPGWTASLGERLLFGFPVGVEGSDGFSNLTDVRNVVALISHVVRQADAPAIMHLAEFADCRWAAIVDNMAAMMGVVPVRAAGLPYAPPSLRADMAAAWSRHRPLSVARELMRERIAGSVLRSAARLVPGWMLQRLRSHKRGLAAVDLPWEEALFLRIMTSPRRFESVLPEGWQPPVSWSQSWADVGAWMRDAGFVIAAAG